jgi:MoaA/NifB/PqqE/SkfB family radical SAM enzyme
MLHVLVGAACNNNCSFCMESDRRRRTARVRAQSAADVRAMLSAYGKLDQVLFTSGEPTLEPELVTYVGWAREVGFRTIALITNGRRLAYAGYARALLEAGLTRITVSIHGHTPTLHDGLTRSPGSFAQTLAGLENLRRLRRTTSLELHTSTVVTRRNLPHLEAIVRLLLAHGVDVVVLNVMMAQGRGATLAPQLLAPYPAVVQAVARLGLRLTADELRRLRVEDVPPCLARGLPASVAGSLEEYEQFEESGSTGLSEYAVLNPRSSIATVPEQPTAAALPAGAVLDVVRETVSAPDLRGDEDYYLSRRSFKERLLRVKGPPCEACQLAARCPGVWEPYVQRYGWAEFLPIEEAAEL